MRDSSGKFDFLMSLFVLVDKWRKSQQQRKIRKVFGPLYPPRGPKR
jgi:hypothetical protein